jgi:hypothetical protein
MLQTYAPPWSSPFQSTDTLTTYDKTIIEQKLMEENKMRFNQAATSPFLCEPLVSLVGKWGEGNGVTQILEGKLNQRVTDQLDDYTKLLLKYMVKPNNYQPLTVENSLEEFIKGWTHTREHTASGRSTLHFGHFISACKHSQLSTLEQTMAEFPLRVGYSPKRWQQGIEVMLLKRQNCFHVSKLRAILLFEADYNHNKKNIGRKLMQHAEKYQWIAPEQYGSRKALSAIDHCLNKLLSFDIIRQNKRPAAICINDMKGCYDRIVHSVASICMQRLGMAQEPLRSLFWTLQHLEHYIRTAYGPSTTSFRANQVHPVAIQGIGQGNGAGPQIWAAISSVVLDMLRGQGMGAFFEAPITKEKLHIAGYAYVDDTDIITYNNDFSPGQVMEKIQQNINLWTGGLSTTGGQLEPSKTYWYNIQFLWNQGRWKYATIQETPGNVTTTDAQGNRVVLERVEVQEARRTLGVRIAPDGNNGEEFRYLKEQADDWADRIRSGLIPRTYTWQAFSSTILAKLAYALPATTLSREECSSITKQLIAVTLAKSGINSHMPRDLVFGAISRQGLGFPDLYVWQGAESISRVVQFWNTKTHITK